MIVILATKSYPTLCDPRKDTPLGRVTKSRTQLRWFSTHTHRVINWADFNTIYSQGIGMPEESERDGGMAGRWNSQNTVNNYRWSLLWTWFIGPQNNYKRNMKDLWSQITITNTVTMKKFETLQKLPNHDREIRNDQMLWGKWWR